MTECVDIIMATYNGEKYIREQIQSIQAQPFTNWILIISDDYSQDDTVKIIKEMQGLDKRIELVNCEKQGGIVENFNKALSFSKSQYIFLADQDDIWVENRLNIMLDNFKKIEADNAKKSILMFTDLELIDSDGNIIAESFYQYNDLNPYTNMKPNMLIWRSTVYGCSTLFNRKLLEESFPIPNYASMHDQWLALKAHMNNGLFYYDYKSLKYRQHSNNAVGGAGNGFIGKIKKSKRNFKSIKLNVEKVKKNLNYNENQFYSLPSYFFPFQVVLPTIILGEKRLQSFLFFIIFILL
ncbi:glycosyltransferase family 2 protein [Acinetobacter populi]|uniref:Glycosyltransferase 2-like domain-containing protein n=1 Tax=Acinetobacter populi TaxID=1582270 RepID=A0A1Z9YWV5_9GAMM|nr:glycosyltransferase family 2 protein [Acinetobacter populi]OUY06687.1 hypothetical protein CAP51_12210 [Acinetobacter populi]